MSTTDRGRVARVLGATGSVIVLVGGVAITMLTTALPAAAQSGLEQSKSTTISTDWQQNSQGQWPPGYDLSTNGLDVSDQATVGGADDYTAAFSDIYTKRGVVVETQAARLNTGSVRWLSSWMAPNDTELSVDVSAVTCPLVSYPTQPRTERLVSSNCRGAVVTANPQSAGISTSSVIYVADDFTQANPAVGAPHAGSVEFHAVKGATLHVAAPGIVFNAATGTSSQPCVASISGPPDGMTIRTDGAMTYSPAAGAAGGQITVSYGLGRVLTDGSGGSACVPVTSAQGTTHGTVTIFLSGATPPTVIPIVVAGWGPYGSSTIPHFAAFPGNPADWAAVDTTGVQCTTVWANGGAVSDLASLAAGASYPIYSDSASGPCSGASLRGGGHALFVYSGTYAVTPAAQTLTLTDVATGTLEVGETFTPHATSTSGLAPVITVAGGCEKSGDVVTMKGGASNCVVTANQAGGGNYLPAPTVSESVHAAPNIAIQDTASPGVAMPVTGGGWPAGQEVALVLYGPGGHEIVRGTVSTNTDGQIPGDTALTVPSTAAPGVYSVMVQVDSVTASTTSLLTVIDGPTFSLTKNVAAGDPIDLDGAGWPAGAEVTVVMYDPSGSEVKRGALEADANGRLPSSVGIDTSGLGNWVYSVVASAGDARATTDIAIGGPFSQTLSFASGEGEVPTYAVGYGQKFRPEATSDSALTPVISVSGACQRDPSTGLVTMTASSGKCIVTAFQAGNAYFKPATISQQVEATKAGQALSRMADTFPTGVLPEGSTFTPAVYSSAGLIPLIDASGACEIDAASGVVTITASSGNCIVTVSQSGDLNYEAAGLPPWMVSATAGDDSGSGDSGSGDTGNSGSGADGGNTSGSTGDSGSGSPNTGSPGAGGTSSANPGTLPQVISQTVNAGGSATWSVATPSAAAPILPSIVTPNAGTVTFAPLGEPPAAPPGFAMLGLSFEITAPAATAADPLRLGFAVDEASLPPGTDPSALTVFRDGIAVAPCSDPEATVAAPDPCVNAVRSAGGVTTLSVLSSHASVWSIGTAVESTAGASVPSSVGPVPTVIGAAPAAAGSSAKEVSSLASTGLPGLALLGYGLSLLSVGVLLVALARRQTRRAGPLEAP